MPKLYLPGGFLVPFLKMFEFIVNKLGLSEPAIASHVIYKVSVTHYGCTKSAKQDVGYEPLTSVTEALEYCKEQAALQKA